MNGKKDTAPPLKVAILREIKCEEALWLSMWGNSVGSTPTATYSPVF